MAALFTSGERRGLIVLILILITIVVVLAVRDHRFMSSAEDTLSVETASAVDVIGESNEGSGSVSELSIMENLSCGNDSGFVRVTESGKNTVRRKKAKTKRSANPIQPSRSPLDEPVN